MNCNDKICDWYSFQLEVKLHLNRSRFNKMQWIFPQVVKRIDSLDDCQERNLIHFIKDAGRNQLVH